MTPQQPSEPVDAFPGGRFSAAIYDPFLWLGERFGMRRRRRDLLADARGRVLEIGAGTGLNVRHYPAELDELVLAEPNRNMAAKIDVSAAPCAASVAFAAAEELPFSDDSFDTVVSTMVLCTVGDAARAVAEIRRVLLPGGRLLFCEHVRSESPRLARWQDRFAEPWAAFADGCRCDRATVETIGEQMRIERLERSSWRGMPAIVHPLATGEAV